jgi:outer membrane protein assembly factor BamB
MLMNGPIVAGGTVYISSAEGKVYALDAGTGMEVWWQPFETSGEIWATPIVYDGVVYIGSFDKNLYSIDAAIGHERGRFRTDGAIAASATAYWDTIYFGSFDHKFYAVNLDGTEKWRWDEASDGFQSKPVGVEMRRLENLVSYPLAKMKFCLLCMPSSGLF